MRAVAVDDRRDLDDGVGRQVGHRAVVADVDDLDVARAVVERGDELRRGLAVERPAAVLEQLRLLGQRLVAVELEEARLDGHDVARPACGRRSCSARTRPGQVVVAQVVGRDGADPSEQVRRQAQLAPRARRRPVASSSGSRSTPSTRTARSQLRWFRPTCSRSTRSGADAEALGQPPLQGDRHVAQAERPMAVVEERLGHDPDRVREVDDPGARRAPGAPRARRGRGRPARSAAPWRSRRPRSSPGR